MTQPDPSLSPPRSAAGHVFAVRTMAERERAIGYSYRETSPQTAAEYEWRADALFAAADALASSSPSRERGETMLLEHIAALSKRLRSDASDHRYTSHAIANRLDAILALAALPLSVEPKQEPLSEADERRLLDIAFGFHVGIEGEYGCPGATCPGVQRLVERMRALKGVGRYDYKVVPPPPAEEDPTPPSQGETS